MDKHGAFQIGYLEVEREEHVSLIVMQRPEKLNAMTAAFWSDLREVLDRLAADGETRVAIITGGGDRAFSAGGDIAGFLNLGSIEEMRAYQIDAMSAFVHVEQSPLIVIAAVNGIAFGGGCELALASDIVIASDISTFALPEAALGLVPGFGVLRAPEVIGRQLTKFLVATGERIDARRAFEIGLVHRVMPANALLFEAKRMGVEIAARSPAALETLKRMVNRTIDDGAIDYSVKEITALHSSEDCQLGVDAFLAKRKPVFSSRVKGVAR